MKQKKFKQKVVKNNKKGRNKNVSTAESGETERAFRRNGAPIPNQTA